MTAMACAVPRCPYPAVHRGRCRVHRMSTTQRGYGVEHQGVRAMLALSLPAPCGYCGTVIAVGASWVAAHRVDGQPQHGYVVAHGECNERAKGRRDRPSSSLHGGRPPADPRSGSITSDVTTL